MGALHFLGYTDMATSWRRRRVGNEDFYLSDLGGDLALHSGPRMERDSGLDSHMPYKHRNWTGVPAWDEMTRPNLSSVLDKPFPQKVYCSDFRGLDAPGLDLSFREIICCDFRGAVLSKASFFRSEVGGRSITSHIVTRRSGEKEHTTEVITVPTSFARANLGESDFRESDLRCDFREANLDYSMFDAATVVGDLSGASFLGATFIGADVRVNLPSITSGVDFSMSRITLDGYINEISVPYIVKDCQFAWAEIKGIGMWQSQISNCSFNWSILPKSLSRCSFLNCTFRRSLVDDGDWRDVEFTNCELQDSYLFLRGKASFVNCDLSRTILMTNGKVFGECEFNFDNCVLDGANFVNCSPQGTYSGTMSVSEWKESWRIGARQRLIRELNKGPRDRLQSEKIQLILANQK